MRIFNGFPTFTHGICFGKSLYFKLRKFWTTGNIIFAASLQNQFIGFFGRQRAEHPILHVDTPALAVSPAEVKSPTSVVTAFASVVFLVRQLLRAAIAALV